MEVDQDFVQRNAAGQHHPPWIERFGVLHGAALFGNQRHHIADVFVRTNHERFDHWLLDFLNVIRFRQVGGIVDFLQRLVRQSNAIDDAGIGRNDVHAVFATQPFLHDLQMQQTQEPTAKTEAQRDRTLRLVNKRRVVELQFREIGLQMRVVGRVDRINAAEDHRVHFQEARQGRRRTS